MVIHGYLLLGDRKMSKSLGNVLDPNEVIDRFGADALRFYCFREVSFGQDGSVSAAGFEARYEAELANDWGNLASRTLAMIERYRDGVVPAAEVDQELAGGDDGLAGVERRVAELLDAVELSQALETIWSRVRRLNQYVEENRPWDLAKDPAAASELDRVLYNLAEGVRVLGLLLHAYMPVTSDRVLDALGESSRELAEFGSGSGGQRAERIPPLFPKLAEAPA
jgi:methionyl-tRNA synthetase